MENLEKPLGKNLSSESARARSQKQQKEASRHAAPIAAPDARERIPCAGGTARSYHFKANSLTSSCMLCYTPSRIHLVGMLTALRDRGCFQVKLCFFLVSGCLCVWLLSRPRL